MDTFNKHDVVVRFDVKLQALAFFVADQNRSGVKLKELYRIPILAKVLTSSDVELIAKVVTGYLLMTYSPQEFSMATDNLLEPTINDESEIGTPQSEQSTYELALEQMATALRNRSANKMAAAHKIFIVAADAGDKDAIKFLEESWPTLKARSDENFK